MVGRGIVARAGVSPYTPDTNTLFLFHFDEAAGSSAFANLGSVGGTAYSVDMSTASSSPPVVTTVSGAAAYTGFGNAVNLNTPGYLIGFDADNNGTYDGESAESIPMSELNMGNGGRTPWTLEALIRPTAINQNQEIISTDSSTDPRGFQFRIDAAGELELNLISISGADFKTAIPSTAADPVNGFVANQWYHVAATYDGTYLVLYWTKLSSSVVAANPISTNTVSVRRSFGSVLGPLTIGNENRAAAGENFLGLIDEVRISNIARTPTDMLRGTGTPAVSAPSINPTNDPVYAGTPVTLSAGATGASPLDYSWRTDGASGGSLTNIPGANSNLYSFDTTSMTPGAYRFDVVVTNTLGSATSSVVTLNLAAASGPVLTSDTMINPSTVYSGSSVTLLASFTGSEPIAYQWYFTTNGGGTGPVAGATSASYTLASAQTNNAGSYFLMASNNPPGLGSLTTSSTPATLTVLAQTSPTLTNLGLFCDLLEYPEETVISDPHPKFGWVYHPSFRDDSQSAYQMIVSSSLALANADTGDLWDSGAVASSNSINVPYAGAPLQPRTNYFWRVRTMDSVGQWGSYSGVQQFNTAGTLSDPLTTAGVVYQQPAGGSVNCYPLRYVPVAPVLITTNSLGHWFIDFGKDAFGYARVHLNGNFSGTTVTAYFGEKANGMTVNLSPGATIRSGSSTFTLQNGDVVYEVRPPTDSHTINPPSAYGNVMPFRYLELAGIPGGATLTVTDVTQQRLQTEFDDNAATFDSSSAALNQVWALCKYSMKALSFDGIYVDGDRERTPYEADTYIHQLSSYGVNNDFTMARCSFEYLTSHLTWPTEWPMHMVFVAWADYQQTGDTYLMTKYYSFLTNQCLLLSRVNPANGLVQSYPASGNTASGDIIDWYRISGDGIGNTDGYVPEATNAVINAFYYRCMTIMTQIAQLTGHTTDAADFAARASQVYSNYDTAFWNASSQSYNDGMGTTHSSADANFFPLAFGLVPPDKQAAVVSYIDSRIAALGAMPAGVYGAQYLLQGLFEAEDADTALGLMITNNTRSWMNMINIGSTITAEAWSTSDKANEDWNHAWGAAPGNLIPRYVLGLRPLEAGYGRVLIQPHLGHTLSYVQGTIPTVRGPVSIAVTNNADSCQMSLDIPGNVVATVMLPATNTIAIVDGAAVSGSLSNNWLTVMNIGSGAHTLSTGAIQATNHPPVAATYTALRYPGLSLRINLADLKAGYWSDPDSDDTELAGVDSSSTNGVNNVSTNAEDILYTPGTNGDVPDEILYTIRDVPSGGGTPLTATGYIHVQVSTSVAGQAIGVTTTNNSAVVVDFEGIPSYGYTVQRATNVMFTGTLREWSINAPSNGLFQVTDDFSDLTGPPPQAYYRLRYNP